MQEFLEADYGDYTRLIIAPSMREGRIIREMYRRLVLPKISDLAVLWPIPQEAELTVWQLCAEINKLCASPIQRIAKMIRCELEPIGFDWLEGLTPESFLNWWLSTEPVPNPDGGDLLLVGLPYIMQLLGDKYQPTPKPAKDLEPLSGDNDANLLAALCLSFEGTEPTSWDGSYSVVFLDQLLEAAGKLRERAEKAAKEKEKEDKPAQKNQAVVIKIEPLEPSDRFVMNYDRLVTSLTELQISVPAGF